jgi:NDP-sugar pyrophosphorylase family protein
MQVVVLAGGLATRMRPLSTTIPKVLFPVAGRPFLDHQLALLQRGGASRVVLLLGHLHEQVLEHLAQTPPPVPVAHAVERELLGTGGALRAALEQGLLEERFVLTYGDSYLTLPVRDLAATHARVGLRATMAVLHNQGQWDASNCVVQGDRVVRYEKIKDPAQRPPEMTWVDYGMTLLERSEVERWRQPAPFDLAGPVSTLAREGQLAAHPAPERFYEIGSPQGLAELEQLLRTRSTP